MSLDYGLERGLRLAFFVFDVFAVGELKPCLIKVSFNFSCIAVGCYFTEYYSQNF